MNDIIIAAMCAGFVWLLGQRIADNPPKQLAKWWHDLDQLPALPRKWCYIMLAAYLASTIALTALLTTRVSPREYALETGLRQCEDRQRDSREEQHPTSSANPIGNLPPTPDNIGPQQKPEQASTKEGHKQPQEYPAKLIPAASVNRHGNDKQHQVDRQRLSSHTNPSHVVSASITQGGAA